MDEMIENNIEMKMKFKKLILLALYLIKLVKNLTKSWFYWHKVVS